MKGFKNAEKALDREIVRETRLSVDGWLKHLGCPGTLEDIQFDAAVWVTDAEGEIPIGFDGFSELKNP
jgi:hypothetical protein